MLENKNSKSKNYLIREAENIIENYLKNRELSDSKKYYQLKERYERLKILTIAVMVTSFIGTLLSILL